MSTAREEGAQSGFVVVQVKSDSHEPINFKIRRTKPLSKLIAAYKEKIRVPQNAVLRFLYDGENIRIDTEQTPNDLEMEDGAVIEVNVQTHGGGHRS